MAVILGSGGSSVAVLDTTAPFNANFSWTEPFPVNGINIAYFMAKPPQSHISALPAGWTSLGGIACGTSTSTANDGGAVWLEVAYKQKTTETVSSEVVTANGQLNPGITGNVIVSTANAELYSSRVTGSSPEVYLPLYGSASTAFEDASGNGRDGSHYGTATGYSKVPLVFGSPDTPNECVQFVGSSYVYWYDPSSWWTGTSITAEAWIKPTSLATTQSIWQRDEDSQRLWNFRIVGSKLQLTVWTQGGGSFTVTGSTTLVINRSYHVAATYNGITGKLTVYLNGVPDGTVTATGTGLAVATGTAELAFAGSYNSGTNLTNGFTGYIDDPAVYATALSDAQVLSHYQAAAVSATGAWDITATFGADTDETTVYALATCGTTLPFTAGDIALVLTATPDNSQSFYDNAGMFTIPGCVVPIYPTSLITFGTSTGGNANVKAFWYQISSGTATGPPTLSTYSSGSFSTSFSMAVLRIVPPASPKISVSAASADINVVSPPGIVEVGIAPPGTIAVISPPATLEVIEHVGEIDASLQISVTTSAVLRAMDPATAASEGISAPVEVQIWRSDNSKMLAVADGRTGMNWLDDMNDAGSAGFDLSRWDPKATTENMALFNLVRYIYAGHTRFASRIEQRQLTVSGGNDHADQVWQIRGRGVLALLADAALYPEYGVNEYTRKQRSFFFGSKEGSWYVASEWFPPMGMQQNQVPNDHPWFAQPPDWPDNVAQWIWPNNLNQPANPGTVWFRSEFTLADPITVTIYATADDQVTLFVDGFPALATVAGDKHSFRRSSQFSVRMGKGTHLLAAEVLNTSDSIEEVQPIVKSNEVRPSYAVSSNDPYISKGYTDGGHPYVNSNGSVDGGGPGAAAFDGDENSYWMSVGNYLGWSSAYEWTEGTFPAQTVTAVRVKVRGGPYTVYVSLKNGGNGWNGGSTVPYRARAVDAGTAIRYVKELRVERDGNVTINIPAQTADRIRITMSAEWDSGIWQYRWRAALYDVVVTSESREGTYIRGGNFAGLLVTVAAVDDTGAVTGIIHRSQSEGWLCKTGERPGWRPSHILTQIIDEAKARNVLGVTPIKLGFTEDVDSYGVPWSMARKDVAYGIGDDYLSIVKKLAEDSEMDVWIEPDTLFLHAAPKRGNDKTVGADVVILRPGQSLTDFSVESNRPAATRLIVESEFGWQEVADFEPEATYGRVEGFVSLGNALSIEEARTEATNELDRFALESYDTTIRTTDVTGPRPYIEYDVGDLVMIPTGIGGESELGRNRVLSFKVSEGDAGELDITVEADRDFAVTELEPGEE